MKINGRLKVKTLQQEFKKEFGLSLRLYDGNSFADEDATLASIRKGNAKGGEISPRKNMKVGNLEDLIKEEYDIKAQIAGSDNSYLVDNELTLAKALEKDQQRMIKKTSSADKNTEELKSENNDFDITQLSITDFKKLLVNIKDKDKFESNLLKQIELNPDFWSYLLIYDHIVNNNTLILSQENMDDAQDIFTVEWWEIEEEETSLAQFVLDKLDLDFEDVHLNKKDNILYKAAFGSYLYFCMMNFSYEIEAADMASFIASNDHTMIRDGEDVFDKHSIGDDWIIDMTDEWLLYCGFDSSDYEGECEIRMINGDYQEFSIDYESMAGDIISQFE